MLMNLQALAGKCRLFSVLGNICEIEFTALLATSISVFQLPKASESINSQFSEVSSTSGGNWLCVCLYSMCPGSTSKTSICATYCSVCLTFMNHDMTWTREKMLSLHHQSSIAWKEGACQVWKKWLPNQKKKHCFPPEAECVLIQRRLKEEGLRFIFNATSTIHSPQLHSLSQSVTYCTCCIDSVLWSSSQRNTKIALLA